jgi:hypothetical protein
MGGVISIDCFNTSSYIIYFKAMQLMILQKENIEKYDLTIVKKTT